MITQATKFADALAAVENFPVEDQAALVEVLNKGLTSARRQQMAQEFVDARAAYRQGRVKRGSAADLVRELRRK